MNSSLFNPTSDENPSSQPTIIHNFTAQSSTFNNVGRDQYITHVYPTPLAGPSNAPPPGPSPCNDAPVDNLSIHFTGRKRELALIGKAFEKRRDIPLRCALHGNQGVGKSQLTYLWAKSTFSRKENAYIMWISATTVEKLFQGFCRHISFFSWCNTIIRGLVPQYIKIEIVHRLEDDWMLAKGAVEPVWTQA